MDEYISMKWIDYRYKMGYKLGGVKIPQVPTDSDGIPFAR